MNCLTRTGNVLSSTTSFQCVTKSLHVFSNITSQADLSNRRSVDPRQRGGSVPRDLGRNSSNFCIHPEKLKQIIKEKDGQMLCNFFDSEEYQKRIAHMTHIQKQLISQGTPIGTKDEDVRYEHVLSCAQPKHKRKEYVVEKPEARVSEVRFRYEKQKVPKKITIMSAILKKKNAEDQDKEIVYANKTGPILPVVKKTKLHSKESPKKYKKISTILPIYLKKIEKDMQRRQQETQGQTQRSYYRETAKKMYNTDNIDFDKQVLNVRNYEARSNRDDDEDVEERKESKEPSRTKEKPDKEKCDAEGSRKGAIFYPNLKLVKYNNYIPKHRKIWPPQQEKPWPPLKKIPSQKVDDKDDPSSRDNFKVRGHSDNEIFTQAIMVDTVKPVSATKKSRSEPSTQMEKMVNQTTHVEQVKTAIRKQLSFLTKKLSRRKVKKTVKLGQSAKENLPAITEFEVEKVIDTPDLNKVCRRNMSTYRLKVKPKDDGIIDDVLMLYEKVKLGTTNDPLPIDTARYPFEREELQRELPLDRSPTYKVVASSKNRREKGLKHQFGSAAVSGRDHVHIEVVKSSRNEVPKDSIEGTEEIRTANKSVGRSSMPLMDSRRFSDAVRDKEVSSYADVVKENREKKFAKRAGKLLSPLGDFKTKLVDVKNESGNIDSTYEENRKLGKRMMRPPTPFVDFMKKDSGGLYNRTFHRLLSADR